MKFLLLICASFVRFENVCCAEQRSFLDALIKPYRYFRVFQHALSLGARSSRTNETSGYMFWIPPSHHQSSADDGALQPKHMSACLQKYQPIFSDDTKFPCPLNNTISKSIPESVNELRPGDIKVIGTIGDSLSVGLGVTSTNFINLLIEERGLSFTEGGQGTWREYLTIPNILKIFNPNVIGYSVKSSLSIERESQFNVAETGAISADIPYMAKILVKRITNDHRVDLRKDWKMVNVLIGANDFCAEICYTEPPELILDYHKNDLLQALRTLRDNLPRTFVNLILPPNVEQLAKVKGLPNECYVSHSVLCPCIIGLAYRKYSERYASIISKWQQLEIEVANYKEFDLDDFQVVPQPLFVNYSIPKRPNGLTDFSYLAADCFHFSQKGGALVTKLLWNTLLIPVGQKQFISKDNNNLLNLNCPSEAAPYLFTKKNSAQN